MLSLILDLQHYVIRLIQSDITTCRCFCYINCVRARGVELYNACHGCRTVFCCAPFIITNGDNVVSV